MSLPNLVTSTPYISKTLWGDPITNRVNQLSTPPIAKLIRDTAQSIPNGSQTGITFTATEVDSTGNIVSGSNLILPANGMYMVASNLDYAANGTGQRGLFIFSSANLYPATQRHFGVNAGAQVELNAAGIFHGLSGDSISLQTVQSSGGALSTVATAQNPTYLALYLLYFD